jgi:hypothetical protein
VACTTLHQLYVEDQAERLQRPIDWSVLSTRDRERRTKVRRLLAVGELADEWDYYWAAVVLMHGDEVDREEAFELARRAIEFESRPLQIRAFYALAKDRVLLDRGEPQWYGTQKMIVNDKVVLAPIDSGAVTDEERMAMGVITLVERHQEVDFINRALAEQRRRAAARSRG